MGYSPSCCWLVDVFQAVLPNHRNVVLLNIKAMQSLDEEDYKDKKKAFDSAMISAWINTRLERDKQLLGLSATSVGLLVTLLRTVGVQDHFQLMIFILALVAFLITIISILLILDKNSTHIENVLGNSETESEILAFLDQIAGISFVFGMLLVAMIGVSSANTKLNEKGTVMSQQPSSNNHSQLVSADSLNGVAKLVMPTPNGQTHSLNGIAKLKPQSPAGQSPQNASMPSSNAGSSGKAESESSSSNP
jgi:hypothetical protein